MYLRLTVAKLGTDNVLRPVEHHTPSGVNFDKVREVSPLFLPGEAGVVIDWHTDDKPRNAEDSFIVMETYDQIMMALTGFIPLTMPGYKAYKAGATEIVLHPPRTVWVQRAKVTDFFERGKYCQADPGRVVGKTLVCTGPGEDDTLSVLETEAEVAALIAGKVG